LFRNGIENKNIFKKTYSNLYYAEKDGLLFKEYNDKCDNLNN
jgi:hypothetical protein